MVFQECLSATCSMFMLQTQKKKLIVPQNVIIGLKWQIYSSIPWLYSNLTAMAAAAAAAAVAADDHKILCF